MSKFNFSGAFDDMKNDANKKIEKQISDKIRQKFPEIINFSVKVNLTTGKITITGLTPEQVEQVK